MIIKNLSDDQLSNIIKDIDSSKSVANPESVRRHRNGTGGHPTPRTIGIYQKALEIPNADIDVLIYQESIPAPGQPSMIEIISQYQELVAELNRRSNLAFDIESNRVAAKKAFLANDLVSARKYLENVAASTRAPIEFASGEHARSLAALGALAFTDQDFVEARARYGEAINLPYLDQNKISSYKHSYLVAANATIAESNNIKYGRCIFAEIISVGVQPNVVTYSTLINLADTYAEGRKILDEMVAAGVKPNVVTYNTLINLAGAGAGGRKILDEMVAAGVKPDVFTYSTLINLADTYAEGRKILDEMVAAGVKPNVVTYNTLINLADTYAEGRKILDEMVAAGVKPNEIALTKLAKGASSFESGCELALMAQANAWRVGSGLYRALFSLPIHHFAADKLIEHYKALPKTYEVALESPIRQYRSHSLNNEAMELCLFSPHLPAARKMYREMYSFCKSYLISAEAELTEIKNVANIHYCFGIVAIENGDWAVARERLKEARSLAYAQARIKHIDEMLESMPA